MSDLLQVIIDFNIDKLCQNCDNQINGGDQKSGTPLETLLDSVIKFLNAFQISSALNRYKIYLAMPGCCKLVFPIEDSSDSSNLQKFAFENVRDTIYQRVFDLIKELTEQQTSSRTAISQAFLKAICYANKEKASQKVLVSSEIFAQEMVSSRILFIQMDKDDPTQYVQMVNGIFAAQKLQITIDAIILKETLQEYREAEQAKKAETKTPYLLIQASQQTNGVFRELPGNWCDPKHQGSMLFFELINNFLPSPFARKNVLRIPTAASLDQVKMSSTCVCHNQVISIGYACSNCLSLHCFQPVIDQLKEIDQDKKDFKKSKKDGSQEKSFMQQVSYPKLREMEQKALQKCKKCSKQFE